MLVVVAESMKSSRWTYENDVIWLTIGVTSLEEVEGNLSDSELRQGDLSDIAQSVVALDATQSGVKGLDAD